MKLRGDVTAYRNWAPDGVLWTEWAKPILFAESIAKNLFGNQNDGINIPKIGWIESVAADTAVVVDLPCKAGVEEAMALARMGYRPVPLYNGVVGSGTIVVDTAKIAAALISCAGELAALNIEDDAPPVFMLDSNRMAGGLGAVAPGMFDNRWSVFAQDMPSAFFLREHGIKTVIVRTAGAMQSDLSRIMYDYQKEGLVIRMYDGTRPVRVIRVSPQSVFGALDLFHRFEVIFGLRRNAAGGFGGIVPDQSSSGGG